MRGFPFSSSSFHRHYTHRWCLLRTTKSQSDLAIRPLVKHGGYVNLSSLTDEGWARAASRAIFRPRCEQEATAAAALQRLLIGGVKSKPQPANISRSLRRSPQVSHLSPVSNHFTITPSAVSPCVHRFVVRASFWSQRLKCD